MPEAALKEKPPEEEVRRAAEQYLQQTILPRNFLGINTTPMYATERFRKEDRQLTPKTLTDAEEHLSKTPEKEIPKFDNSVFREKGPFAENIMLEVTGELIKDRKDGDVFGKPIIKITEIAPEVVEKEIKPAKISAQTEVKPTETSKPEVASVEEIKLWLSDKDNLTPKQAAEVANKDVEIHYGGDVIKAATEWGYKVPDNLHTKPQKEQMEWLMNAIEKNPLPYYKRLAENPDVFQRVAPDLYQKYQEFKKQQEAAVIITEQRMTEAQRKADEIRKKIEDEFLAKGEKKEGEKSEEKKV